MGPMMMSANNWLHLRKDNDSGIETIRAHFEGHAYDPHWHDSYLVGLTEQGVQRFHRGRIRHDSTPGQVMLLEPGDIHDGDAPAQGGFTYRMLYLDPHWLDRELRQVFDHVPEHYRVAFAATVANDAGLAGAIDHAFEMLHTDELRIVRQSALDQLFDQLTRHIYWRQREGAADAMPKVARWAREYLHEHLDQDIGMDDLARLGGTDRFRLTRAFKHAYGLPPHAYLVQLRLTRARRLLAAGMSPALVAASLGFADQSHLGRWFRRAYGLTPARYRKHSSNLPD